MYSSGLSRRETELIRPLPQSIGHELYVFIEIYAELLGAPYDVFPVHGRSERLLFHLLADALCLHVLETFGTHEGAGHDEAGELVYGVERFGHKGVARHVQVIGVPLYGVDDVLGIASALQLPDTDHRMLVGRGVFLVVHVVQEAGYSPLLLVLAETAGIWPPGGLPREHVLAQGVTLCPRAHKVP